MTRNERINELINQIKRYSDSLFEQNDTLVGSVAYAYATRISRAFRGLANESVSVIANEMIHFEDGCKEGLLGYVLKNYGEELLHGLELN